MASRATERRAIERHGKAGGAARGGARWLGAAALLAASLVAAGCGAFRRSAHVGPLVELDTLLPSEGLHDADVELDFYAGQLDLRAAQGGPLVRVRSRDNLDEFAPRVELSRSGERANAHVWLHGDSRLKVDFDDEVVNEWQVELSDEVPMSLSLDVAMFDGTLDLGGLRLRRATLSMGLGDGKLLFSKPNLRTLEQLDVELGAGSFRVLQLGHARCANARFELSSGSFELDLGGDWKQPALLRVDGGMCHVTVRVPADLPLRIDASETQLGDLEVAGMRETEPRCWISDAWDSGRPQVVLELNVNLGSVEVVRE
ncbi:MAG: hypothetical protein JNL90_14625 [Planctomycetes bacterium]|nr:hypothetical protein [Planctomycetota bacterium]